MDHLVQLLLNMARFPIAAVIGHQCGGANHDIGHTALTTAIIGAVIAGKTLHQQAGELILAAHEHALPGDKHVVQNCQAFAAHDAVLGIALIDRAAHFSVIVGLAAKNVNYAGGVHRQCAAHRIGFFVFLHPHGGHNQHFVGVHHAGHMGFGTANDDAVLPLLYHVDEHIRILLLAGSQAAVALHIGHRSGDHQVVLLDIFQKLLETFMVVGPHRLVDLISNGIGGVHGIKANAALIAGTGFLRDHPQHLHLFNQVISALVNMGKAVDFFTGQMGCGSHHILIFLAAGQRIGHCCGIYMATNKGVID